MPVRHTPLLLRARPRVAVTVALGVTVAAVACAGLAAPAGAAPRAPQAASLGRTVAVPALNQGETASFQVYDNGRSLTIVGQARGMRGDTAYESLIYPDGRCSTPDGAMSTVDGSWEPRGASRQYLFTRYEGAAYALVKAVGTPMSVSVRAQTAAVNTGGGNFTVTLQARACAPLMPRAR